MFLIITIILTIVMLATSLALYGIVEELAELNLNDVKWYWFLFLPIIVIFRFVAKLMTTTVFGQMVYNFLVSSIIMIFTGAGLFAGAANLIASLLFPLVVFIKKKIQNR